VQQPGPRAKKVATEPILPRPGCAIRRAPLSERAVGCSLLLQSKAWRLFSKC
jgi:hypothetical protein